MQRAEGPSSRLAPEPTPTRPSLSPPVAFLLLAAVIAILGAIVYLTRPEPPATPTNPNAAQQQPDFSLTNEEAITRFKELHKTLLATYRSRDISLFESFMTPESPLRERASTEISQLLEDDVIPKPAFETRKLVVEANSPTEIVVRHITVDRSRFTSESGADLTKDPKRILRTVQWVLRLEGSIWKIHDSIPIRAQVLKGS